MSLFLFDMDGTLTPAREKMDYKMLMALDSIQSAGHKIGIVTGSDFGYLLEQCEIMLDANIFDYSQVHYFPCNGTKYYHIEKSGDLKKIYEKNMKEEIGDNRFNDLVYLLNEIQSSFKYEKWGHEIPLTGNFIDYRKSMLNYCPMGRNASFEDRKKWKNLEKKHNIRKNIFSNYFTSLPRSLENDLTVKLGGETSFDIYPIGWDKTYCLNNIELDNYESVYFFGDACEKGKNDYEIYMHINSLENGRAFSVKSPEETGGIISKLII